MTGVELIAQERQRQIAVEDWDADHDDRHDDGDLARAAMCYADPTAVYSQPGFPPDAWPWESEGWKPKSDAIKNLVRAGALIAAEIDRLARARQAVAGKEEKTK